ncbi:hypothetical protein Tco_1203514 [Tanacetum coccineum]
MTVDDLLQLVPKLITKVDSLETELKQTKLTMGKALVKLLKKVKKTIEKEGKGLNHYRLINMQEMYGIKSDFRNQSAR